MLIFAVADEIAFTLIVLVFIIADDIRFVLSVVILACVILILPTFPTFVDINVAPDNTPIVAELIFIELIEISPVELLTDA